MDNIELVKDRINIVLAQLRPYLQIDEGDVELVDVTDDGIAKIRLIGSCDSCALKPMTLRGGIERAIMRNVPEIKRIEEVN
ncbi:MAG: NifU family protein [Ignavibacteria bacterium]